MSRLRPFSYRAPVDSAEEAANEAQDDYEKEVMSWSEKTILTRRPTGTQQQLSGKNIEWRRFFDPSYSHEDEDSPLYEINRLVQFRRTRGLYQYLVHWLTFSHRHNTWQAEEDLPFLAVQEFWLDPSRTPTELRERRTYERSKKKNDKVHKVLTSTEN